MEQTQQTNKDWLKEELTRTEQNKFDGDDTPSLQLEEGKIYAIEVDFSQKFPSYQPDDKTHKKIIPIVYEGKKMKFWLNVKNPLYGQVIKLGAEGQTLFKVVRSGQKENTRYSLVKD